MVAYMDSTLKNSRQSTTGSNDIWIDDKKENYPNPENSSKEITLNNYRPVMCLPMKWKILREEIYYALECCRPFPEEQNGCRNGTRGTNDLHPQGRKKEAEKCNYCMDRLQKGLGPQIWIIKCSKYPSKLSTLSGKQEELAAGRQTLAEVKIQRGIFKGDSTLPQLFIIVIMLLNYILNNCTESYRFTKS